MLDKLLSLTDDVSDQLDKELYWHVEVNLALELHFFLYNNLENLLFTELCSKQTVS